MGAARCVFVADSVRQRPLVVGQVVGIEICIVIGANIEAGDFSIVQIH